MVRQIRYLGKNWLIRRRSALQLRHMKNRVDGSRCWEEELVSHGTNLSDDLEGTEKLESQLLMSPCSD